MCEFGPWRRQAAAEAVMTLRDLAEIQAYLQTCESQTTVQMIH